MAAPEPRTGRLSAVAYAGMFVFGIVMALLGAILPAVFERLRLEVADIGTLFLRMNLAMLVCSLALGLVIDRFGMKAPLVLGPVLIAGSLVAIVRAAGLPDLLPAMLFLGFGGGALNGATNTLVADLHGDPRRKNAALNRLGVFFGFGALSLPVTIGALLATLGIDSLLLAAALLCAAVGVFAVLPRFPPPKQPQRLPIGEMPRFLRSPAVLATALLLFFQSGIEFTAGGYLTIYLTREMGVSVTGASWLLAAYWLSLMVSRVVLSRILLAADPYRVIGACAMAAAAGAGVLVVAPGVIAASGGLILMGSALAGIFPTVLGITGARFREHSGTVFGILFTVALSGGVTLPWVSAQIAAGAGVRPVFGLVAGGFAAILAINAYLAAARTRS